jgi:uncharacterized protein YceK
MKLILALAIVALASGCASVPMQTAENDTSTTCDLAQMQAVDRASKARVYMYVKWVHCPTLSARPKSVS